MASDDFGDDGYWDAVGAGGDIIAPQPSGSSWDVFGTIGDIFDGAKETITDWWQLKSASDLAKIERDTLREQARLSNLGQPYQDPFLYYGTATAKPVNYPLWSLIFAAIGLLLTGYAIMRKR